MSNELIRNSKNKSVEAEWNPLIIQPKEIEKEKEKPKNDFRRNIKLTDPIFYKIRAIMKVKDVRQYELIDEMADLFINQLSEQEKQFYEYQLEEITKNEESKK